MKIIVHSDRIGEKLMDKKEFALKQHEDWHGKIEVVSRAKVTNREELSVAYTPGVAEPCLEISKDVDYYDYYYRKTSMQRCCIWACVCFQP
jgi:malate dehydrogenase (oxaloacetate-decarboxylating)